MSAEPPSYIHPRPFIWCPIAGHLHAIDRRNRTVPLGTSIQCLCGATHQRGPDDNTEHPWPTCRQCWDETCILVGLRPRQ